MNIVYLSDSIIPSQSANSINVMKMCQAFSENGHSVVLYAKSGQLSNDDNNHHGLYSVKNNFQIKLVNSGSSRFSNLLYIVRAFTSTIRRESLDLIYTRSITATMIAVLSSRSVIFELHQYSRANFFLYRFFLKRILSSKFLLRLVVISKTLKMDVHSDFPQYFDKILIAHDGADPINIKNYPKKINNSFNICYTGSLFTGKGFEIIYPLSLKLSNCDFHIVGGDSKKISDIKSRYDIPKNLHLHGFIEYSKAEKFRLQADILIAPLQEKILLSKSNKSNIARWTSPIKIFEYMATGKIIIASNIPAIREILENKNNAILVSPINIDEWVSAIVNIKKNPKSFAYLGSNAKLLFLLKYTWKKRAKNIIDGVNIDAT